MLGPGGLGEGTVEEEGHHGDGGPRLGEFEKIHMVRGDFYSIALQLKEWTRTND